MWLLAALWMAVSQTAAATDRPMERYPEAAIGKPFRQLASRAPVWLSRDAVELAQSFPDAAQTRAEIDVLLALQAQRTAKDVAQIRREAPDLLPLFVAEAGRQPGKAPKTVSMLRQALAELDYFLFAEKLRLLRPRPHQTDRRIHPAIAVPAHPAFPSGHGGESRLLAQLLANLVPTKAEPLRAYAVAVGKRREIAGVHFPSDTAEGIRIADKVFQQLWSSARFRPVIDAARSEWPAP